jgi:histidinol-phosphate aminotransferase
LHSLIARHTATAVLVGDRRPDFTLDLEAVAATPADITFVCSPNNPTGRAEPREVIERVLDIAPGLVVVDEAYGQFAPWSAMSLVDDDTGVVVVRTFSKTWAMAAVRLGYLVGPVSVVAELDRVVLPYHLSALTQAAGRLALKYQPEMEGRVATIVEERGRVAAALADLDVEAWPSDANFILFRPRNREGSNVWQQLVDCGVLVRDCSSWPGLDGCLRVTIGTPDENAAFVAALKEALA